MDRREEFELENYFSKIQASFFKKFVVTFFDLAYVLIFNVPIFIMFAYWEPSTEFSKVVLAFHKIVSGNSGIAAHRLLMFSCWMFLFLYVYFVLIPSKAEYQTFFSSNLGVRAVILKGSLNYSEKISQAQLFRANLVPVFLLPILNIIFFSVASVAKDQQWNTVFFQSNGQQKHWVALFRAFGTGAFFLQMFYLFTVGASKKSLNWFVKNNGIIWVDTERADLVIKSEDKSSPKKIKLVSPTPSVNEPTIPDIVVQNKSLNIGSN